MFSWFKEKPRKTAIRILRIYDDVSFKPEIVAAPEHVTAKTIEDMKAHPKRYAYNMKMRDGLLNRPGIKIAEITPPEHLEEHDVDIICEVTYTYTTVCKPQTIGPLFKLVLSILLFSAIGLVGIIFFLSEQGKMARIDAQCYYYLHNGTPTSIMIEGEEYRLNSDGSITDEDRIFMNPYHQEMLRGFDQNDCQYINTK